MTSNSGKPPVNHDFKRMKPKKRIALIAHDHCKMDLLDWCNSNTAELRKHQLFGTGTTAGLIAEQAGLGIHPFNSGPLGGDLQIGASIAEKNIDMMVFFWDPLEAQPHDVDVKALLRISVVYNIPLACNRSSADFMISSSLMDQEYDRILIDYSNRFTKDF
jgi:methylglyoxal synthase